MTSRQVDKWTSGQTLIEVIIAIALIVMVLTTLVSGLVLAIRNNRFAKDQALSKDYARETLESLRQFRDALGWDAFQDIVRSDGNSVTYCLPVLPTTPTGFQSLVGSANCTLQIAGTPFVRTLNLRSIGNSQITATVTVTWVEGSKTFSSRSTLDLREWQ